MAPPQTKGIGNVIVRVTRTLCAKTKTMGNLYTKQHGNSSSRSADSPPQVNKMADFRSPYIINFFTPNLAAPNESMVDYVYAARIKIKKG